MTDLELKLEEIARLLTAKYGQEVGIRAGILSASEATARYCADKISAVKRFDKVTSGRPWMEVELMEERADGDYVRFDDLAAILRECGVKE